MMIFNVNINPEDRIDDQILKILFLIEATKREFVFADQDTINRIMRIMTYVRMHCNTMQSLGN